MNDKIYAYNNFNIDMNGDGFPILVWSAWAAVIVAIAFSLIMRNFTGALVYRLKNAQAKDESSARSLAELGFHGFQLIVARFLIKDSSSLLRYVKLVSADEVAANKNGFGKFWQKHVIGRSFRISEARFFLPEEMRIGAETRFSPEPHPWRSFIIASALLTAGAVFVLYALPELLLMLDNFITHS